MSNIPTAEELIFDILSDIKCDNEIDWLRSNDGKETLDYLVNQVNSRTKLHVEAALKAAAETQYPSSKANFELVNDKLLNAYPLENIK